MPSFSSFFSSLFQNRPDKPEYHQLTDSPSSGGKQMTKSTDISEIGDRTYQDLIAWESKFPKDRCEIGGPIKTFQYAQKVLKGLLEGHALSRSNTDEIGCHLWAIADTSKRRIGGSIMHYYLFNHLPDILGDKNKDLSAEIRCAMVGSPNRVSSEKDSESR